MKTDYKKKCSIGSVPDETAAYIAKMKRTMALKSEGEAVKIVVDFYIKNNV